MNQKNQKNRRYQIIAVVCIILMIAAIIAGTVITKIRSRQSMKKGDTETAAEEVLSYNGREYVPKKNIETYLFMGIDDRGKAGKKEEFDGTGQSDVLTVLVRDRSDGTYRTLSIDRDTMTEIKNIMSDGTVVATTTNQIALSHIRGDGMELNCENTVDAVSHYLKGQKIDGYASLNMGAIRIINQMAGGVEVTIEDDFSEADPSLKMGETLTLTDDQAEHYIHDRMNVGDGFNESRMRRQSMYMDGLEKKLREKAAEDPKYMMSLYDSVSEYMVTDISKSKFGKIASEIIRGDKQEPVTIEGSRTISEETGFMEFVPDEDSVMQAVLTLFYKEQ